MSSVVCVYTVVSRSRAGKLQSSMSDGHVHVLSSGLSDADGMHTCAIYLHVHCRTRILSGAGNPLMTTSKGNLPVPYNSTLLRIGK